ncbi:ankyrin repeat domain-containing protein [Fulvivirgaceae bacterium BMA12]|uniref:Ankyrin repeat domain-containing protein n=1 Tax=Agaribacillus aureus TaxID=3051825 RepID=A0ABT8LBF2_9BACT|nr:ankyrin repeat domain-containing protein [Fulvivirgaceae bacterium BMA12]
MKTRKVNALKTLLNILLIAILLSACAKSGSDTKAKSVADKPKIDLQTAVISGDLEAVKKHIEAGTDINEKEPLGGSTPLISAATFGKIKIAKALIDAGADLSIKNNDGSTALHAAAFFCRVEIVQMLIDAKADKILRNNFGATPRESVMGPFAEIRPIYEMMQQQLGPLGLQLDMSELEKTRPVIAMMLQ